MFEICKDWCLRLKAINNEVSGCRFKKRGGPDSEILTSATYFDCWFYKGTDIVYYDPADQTIQENFPDQWCMVLPRGQEVQRFAQIRQVGFGKGEFLFDGATMSYVLLRLPENDKIRYDEIRYRYDKIQTRVRQIIIDGVGGDGTVFPPDFELQVTSLISRVHIFTGSTYT